MSGIVEGSEDGIEAGGFASEGGFDLTPFNVCDSIGGKLGVYQVRFEDGSFWQSSAKETKASPGAMKP